MPRHVGVWGPGAGRGARPPACRHQLMIGARRGGGAPGVAWRGGAYWDAGRGHQLTSTLLHLACLGPIAGGEAKA